MAAAGSASGDSTTRLLVPLQPVATNTEMSSVQALSTPTTLTAKQWIVPPRPKPGRKPATDTPPTKRKAQNRAAQRAFRERRAAKVNELEDQMDEMEKLHEQEMDDLRAEVDRLEAVAKAYEQIILDYQGRVRDFEDEARAETKQRTKAEAELAILRGEAVSLPRRDSQKKGAAGPPLGEASKPAYTTSQDISVGCGGCTVATRCACIESAFEVDLTSGPLDDTQKRLRTPKPDEANKRIRRDGGFTTRTELGGGEVDFTTCPALVPSSPGSSDAANLPATASVDSCGFCQDDSACLCAEVAADIASARHTPKPSALPSASTSGEALSAGDGNVGRLDARARIISTGCTSQPGSCTQCKADPESTLFCKSLAATRGEQAEESANGIPADDMTSKTLSTLTSACGTNKDQAVSGPTLSCAEAFQTLSHHPAFGRARDSPESWMSKLASIPIAREETNSTTTTIHGQAVSAGGRTAFEIEAASVMSVLKFFDRQFGQSR